MEFEAEKPCKIDNRPWFFKLSYKRIHPRIKPPCCFGPLLKTVNVGHAMARSQLGQSQNTSAGKHR